MKISTHNASPESRAAGRGAIFPNGMFLLFLLLALSPLATKAQFDISSTPLNTGGGAAANLLYIHDDSGSMYWSFMPDDKERSSMNQYQNAEINKVYFNPNVIYVPPPAPSDFASPDGTLGNAKFGNAWYDGYDAAGRDAAAGNYCSGGNAVPRRVNLAISSYRPTWKYGLCRVPEYGESAEFKTGTVSAHYYDGGTARIIDSTSAGDAALRQNFANWYSYYRTRNYAARAGVARAFDKLGSNVRVGWGRINKSGASSIDGKNVGTLETGVRPFTQARKDEFLHWLYSLRTVSGTPLRKALDDAGRYYDRSSTTSSPGPWAEDPEDSSKGTGTTAAACRKSFTILMTDGYWNGEGASVASGNLDSGETFLTPQKADGSTETWTKKPFSDTYSNALADVAWHYWAKDLYGNSADNKVLGTTNDPAWWQHMTTFTIGLGVAPTQVTKDNAFAAARATPTTLPGTNITWPNGSSYQIDDLLHAGVNGHGDFFSAGNPDEFVKGMESMIASIQSSAAASSKLARNTTGEKNVAKVTASTLVYEVKNDPGWFGRVFARGVCTKADVTNGLDGCTEENRPKSAVVWEASTKIGGHATRNILSAKWNADTPAKTTTGIEFKWSSLDATQQQKILHLPDFDNGQDILNYVRGDSSKEGSAATNFRPRNGNLLGDIFSDPLYFGVSVSQNYELLSALSATEQNDYAAWKNSAAYKSTPGMLYVGANDGMLHGFDAMTGAEKMAYVPASVIPELWKLADPDYTHEFYADITPNVKEAWVSGSWKNVLVGAAGATNPTNPTSDVAGRHSYFAIDVTNPTAFSTSNVLWEFTHPELGYNGAGRASIVRLKGSSGQWVAIFGNGYNSKSHKAQLFVVNLSDGSLVRILETDGVGDDSNPNGLSAPRTADAASVATLAAGGKDQDGAIDTVYAGDMHGNLWRFDLSDPAPASWTVSKLLEAKDPSGNPQPITAQPEAVRIRNIDSADGVMVYVGTGKFFEPGDLTDSSVQSFYAVLDKGDGNTYSRSSGLVQQTIAAAITIEIIDGVARPARTTSSNPVNYAAGDRGFFIDLVRDKERVLKQAEFLSRSRSKGSIVFPSFIPTGDACTGGILGDWTELNALSGQKVDAADAMLFPGANSVEMGPGGTSFGIPLGGIWTELGGGDGGLGCLGCDETPQQRICGNHIAVDSETGVPTLPQCGSPGRKSWRQLR